MDSNPKHTQTLGKSRREAPGQASLPGVRKRLLLLVPLALLLMAVAYLAFSLNKERDAFFALFDADYLSAEKGPSPDALGEKKSEILDRLNVELSQETRGNEKEERRVLTRLDRLWRSVKSYLTPNKERPSPALPSERDSRLALRSATTSGAPPGEGSSRNSMDSERVLYNVFALARDQNVIRKASKEADTEHKEGPHGSRSPIVKGSPFKNPSRIRNVARSDTESLFDQFQSREGVRTRAIVWQLHRNLSLEGTLDTTQVGETDPDLNDFGFRSIHALAFLRGQPGPSFMTGWDKIDSGYPRSFGIGLNLRIAPSVDMLFDYSHEYPNDYLIEYRGNWESSLVTDYMKRRPDTLNNESLHNFFFGLRYLHRDRAALIPLHTGFFYSTNMAQDPLPSDVSMGFSIGGGYHRQDVQLGLAYRLRIWQNPDSASLSGEEALQAQLNTRVSNQLLFYLAF